MKDNLSFDKKKKQLLDLKDEVKDFHPLLNSLLQNLPNITDVDYTHGPTEKGADFIVTKIDTTLGSTVHVGVIAKIGKIATSLTTIHDQIEACDLARVIQSGKNKARLGEIWVITNDKISGQALEKIYAKYRARKITFLQNKDLIKLIDLYLDHYWSCQILPVSNYLISIKKQMDEEDIAQSLLPKDTQNLNVDLKLIQVETDFRMKSRKPKEYNLIDLIKEQTVIVIEGGPGAGKSHLIRKTIEELSLPEDFNKHKYVPIYISYADLCKEHKACISNLLTNQIYTEVKNKMPRDASLILFIDSFDEHIMNNRDVYKEIKALIDESDKIENLHLVITTRPLDIVDYKEIIQNKSHHNKLKP